MIRTRRLELALFSALTVAAALAHGGTADAATFSGSCTIGGIATFGSPLTSTQRINTYDFRSGDPSGGNGADPSKCSGTLNGEKVTDKPVKASVAGPGNLSCQQSSSTSDGSGSLLFADGSKFPFSFRFTGLGTEVDFTAQGTAGGDATGHASFLNHSPPETPLECAGIDANGDGVAGLKQLGFDASLTTSSTLRNSETKSVSVNPCQSLFGKKKRTCQRLQRCKRLKSKHKRRKCIRKVKSHSHRMRAGYGG